MFSAIQQARYIDVSISEFQKHAFESFLALVMFLDIFLPFYEDVNWSHRKMET